MKTTAALCGAVFGALLPAAALAATPAAAPVAQGSAVAPFLAHYSADWRTINVGTSDLELRPDVPPDQYLYTWTVTAHGVFRLVYSHDIVQKSWLAIDGDRVRPLAYRADDGSASVNLNFDWSRREARGLAESKPVEVKLDEGTQDILSIQVQVMLDLKSGRLPKSFRIIDRDEAKDFTYTEEGGSRIRTALGPLDTLVVTCQHPGSDRLLRMWFAPSLGFVPVQAERYRGDKLEFAMRIKTLKR